MGGRGGSSKLTAAQQAAVEPQQAQEEQPEETVQEQTPETTPAIKTNKKQQKIIDYVQQQTNIDLNQWRTNFTAKFEKKNFVLVYWKDMPKNTKYEIEHLSLSYPDNPNHIALQELGAWGMMVYFDNS